MLLRIALIFLVSVVGAWAQGASVPDTPAGHTLQAWVDSFNSGDPVRLAAYFDKYEPDNKNQIDSTMSFRERTGGFNFIRAEKSEPLQIEALVKEREGGNFATLKPDSGPCLRFYRT